MCYFQGASFHVLRMDLTLTGLGERPLNFVGLCVSFRAGATKLYSVWISDTEASHVVGKDWLKPVSFVNFIVYYSLGLQLYGEANKVLPPKNPVWEKRLIHSEVYGT